MFNTNRGTSPRDRRSYKDRPSGQGKENNDSRSASRRSAEGASVGDDEKGRPRDRKRVIIQKMINLKIIT